jgi:cation transporter-like permease
LDACGREGPSGRFRLSKGLFAVGGSRLSTASHQSQSSAGLQIPEIDKTLSSSGSMKLTLTVFGGAETFDGMVAVSEWLVFRGAAGRHYRK